jgi:hypothetical protein
LPATSEKAAATSKLARKARKGDYPVFDWCKSNGLRWLRQAGIALLTGLALLSPVGSDAASSCEGKVVIQICGWHIDGWNWKRGKIWRVDYENKSNGRLFFLVNVSIIKPVEDGWDAESLDKHWDMSNWLLLPREKRFMGFNIPCIDWDWRQFAAEVSESPPEPTENRRSRSSVGGLNCENVRIIRSSLTASAYDRPLLSFGSDQSLCRLPQGYSEARYYKCCEGREESIVPVNQLDGADELSLDDVEDIGALFFATLGAALGTYLVHTFFKCWCPKICKSNKNEKKRRQ